MKLHDAMGRFVKSDLHLEAVGATERSSGTVTGQKTDSACSLNTGLERAGADTGGGGWRRLREHLGVLMS